MLERIRAVIEKTDSMLEGHRSRKSPSPITLLNIWLFSFLFGNINVK